jgi:hypothetical protein
MPFFAHLIFAKFFIMKNIIIVIIFLLQFVGVMAQNSTENFDSNYREDQFYFGLTYNSFTNAPENFNQTGFSPGLKVGFIRDFPINLQRDIAIGIGLGYAFNSYSGNIKISTTSSDVYNYEIVSNNSFQKNRFSHQSIEIPIEFRWRTSTAETYKFWRVYAGFKASYIFASSYVYQNEEVSAQLKNIDLNNLQYGLTLSLGYNNWNGFVYYGLNPVFNDAAINQNSLDTKSFKIGLMFYFL